MRAKNFVASPHLLLSISLLLTAAIAVAQSDGAAAAAAGSIDAPSVTSTVIPSTLFGMSAHDGVLYGGKWPSMAITGMRLWDSHVAWGQINTAKGVYDWSTLDSWISKAASHNGTLVYTVGWTPGWASSKSGDSSCDMAKGACDPPSDLNSDGTGSDQHFIDFVTAAAKHAPSITYWEGWNTPHDIKQWTGTYAQLVRMTQDLNTYVKKYIPSAKIISPANGQLNYQYPNGNCTMADRLGSFLAAGGTKWIDIVGLHTYYDTTAEHIVDVIQCYQSTMSTYKISSLPIWSTEGAWGTNTSLPGSTDQAGFLARLYLLLWSNGVVRHYWYDWNDNRTGTLSSNGVANTAGTAYAQVESWMSGRTMSTLCSKSSSSGIWTCGLTGSGGYAAQAVWHPGGNKSYSAPTKYKNYLDLTGKKHTISSGATVTVGVEPILLQNQ
jgi:polysaccharide biosynthesis protein PslG